MQIFFEGSLINAILLFGINNIRHLCTKQKFHTFATCYLTTHCSTHTSVNSVQVFVFHHFCWVCTPHIVEYWGAWWKWSWIWCQLDWQGTWDVLVLEGEQTRLSCSLPTGGSGTPRAARSRWKARWSAPFVPYPATTVMWHKEALIILEDERKWHRLKA